MRNYNFDKIKATVENVHSKIDEFCHVYFDLRYSENGTEDDADMFFLLTEIRGCLASIMEHSEYPCLDIKTVFHEFIKLDEFVYNISSFINDGIGGEELASTINEVSSLIDPQMLSVDTSVYKANMISEIDRPEKDENEIILENVWMENTTFDAMNGVFNHLWRLGYLSRPHRLIEESDEYGEVEGVTLDFALYKDRADDLIELLRVFTRYAYTNYEYEHDNGWDFRNIINMITDRLDNIPESRKYKNFQLVQYIYNDIMYKSPNPFGEE